MIYLPSHNVISRSQTSRFRELIFPAIYLSPPSAQKNASIFFSSPFFLYRGGGCENKRFDVQNKKIALYFGLAASSKQFRGCRSFSPSDLSRFSPSVRRCSIHSRACTICASDGPPNSIKSLLLPGRARSISRCRARRAHCARGAHLKGSPFSQGREPRNPADHNADHCFSIRSRAGERGHREGARPRSIRARRFSAGPRRHISLFSLSFFYPSHECLKHLPR